MTFTKSSSGDDVEGHFSLGTDPAETACFAAADVSALAAGAYEELVVVRGLRVPDTDVSAANEARLTGG